MKTVIGVCGYSGAGKSTFCREMAARFGLPVLATGEIVRRQVVERGFPLTPESIARVSDQIREETGQRFLRILEPDLCRIFESAPAVLLDCLREESDLLTVRGLADRVALVAIAAPDEVRAARALGRGRPGDPADRSELLALYATEQRLGVAELLTSAGFVVDNEEDLEGFIARAAAAVGAILARHVD
jgi:dephospho-CoA kinase